MARIRSIHPSFFTDEACVSCSALARLLYIGLWTDADDQGLFEWKPLQIKMRLLPGDNVDAGSLLEELIAAGLVAKFTTGEKHLGAIKDFRSYQRPKKPNSVHVLPPEWRTYVGLQDVSSEPSPRLSSASAVRVPNQFPTGGGNPPQMEDGGEDVGEEDIGTSSLLAQTPAELTPAHDAKPSTALVLTGEPSAKIRQAKARGAKFVPDDWQPNAAHFAKAAERGVNIDAEVEKFRLHEFRDPKSDFDRAFHRWLNNANPSLSGPANGFHRPANDFGRPAPHREQSRAERDQQAALDVLAERRGAGISG